MTKGRRVLAWLLLAAALGLGALGQHYFFHRPEYRWDGLVFHGLAAACFLLAWRLSRWQEPHPAPHRPGTLRVWLRERPVPAALLAAGLALSTVATLLSYGRTVDQATGDAVLLWLLGLGAVGVAALWPEHWPLQPLRGLRAWLDRLRHRGWRETAIVAALTLLALVLRTVALDRVPYVLGGDEAWHGLLARQVLTGQLRNPFFMGYMSMPTFFYWPLGWSLWLAGDNLTGLRLLAALAGTATVPILYVFARDLWGRRTAFLSAALLATYDYHIHYSRLGANNVWDPLLVLLALWVLDRGLVGRSGQGEAEEPEGSGVMAQARYRFFLLAGLVMGLSVYFYTGARLLPLLTVAYVAFVWFQRQRRIERLGLHLLLVALACLVAAGPMLAYAQAHPGEWNARINQVGIVQSGWLAREPELTGKSTARILAEQFLYAAGAFHVFPDRTVWYGADRPLLGFLPGLLALLGLAWAAAHWRERRHFLVLLWFWSVVISGGMLTESPPSSQRLVLAIPAVVLLVALGLEQPVHLAGRILLLDRKWQNLALALLLLAVAVGSVHYYFVEFSPEHRYGSINGETATRIGYYLRDLEGNYQAHFFGAPRIYWNFGSMTFLAPGVAGQDVLEPLTAPPDRGEPGIGQVFVFLPERIPELPWVQQAYPQGHLLEFYDPDGRLQFIAYQVP
jgi:4-amino-4-deoxy-L-arabinose transferase-like glycosyltransferase